MFSGEDAPYGSSSTDPLSHLPGSMKVCTTFMSSATTAYLQDLCPKAWLSDSEIEELSSRGNAKRISERIAGRIAGKRAVQTLTGARPGAIRIENLPTGAPQCLVDGNQGPAISISHSNGKAVALANWTGHIGVDLEAIEPRSPSFLQEWLSPEECRLVGGDPLKQNLLKINYLKRILKN